MNESNGKITITKGALTALKDFEYMPLVIDIIFFVLLLHDLPLSHCS